MMPGFSIPALRMLTTMSLILTAFAVADAAAEAPAVAAPTSTVDVVLASEVQWGPLNPARGDASPRAADLWGDRSKDEATGFLVKFKDGFSSPPHIHNVTYRGVVIHGLIHNDDPGAEPMWMPAGSFWSQPAGESHITAAKGEEGGDSLAYIEIQSGPYLVRPSDQAFDLGERPINVDASNVIWLDATNLTWIEEHKAPVPDVKVAFLWGDPNGDRPSGSLLKLPAGFRGALQGLGPSFRAVVIAGQLRHQASGEPGSAALEPGSYFGSTGEAAHPIVTSEESILYIRTSGRYNIVTAKPGE